MKLCLINNTYKVIVKNGVYSGVLFSYTLTINPTPADATVTFSTGTVSGNSCTVADGTSVTYTVSKTGYASETATVTVTADQTINVTLSEGHYTPDQVLYESSTGGASTTLNLLDNGKYQVICIAGGGGGAGASPSAIGTNGSAGGGSGSGFDCVFQLTAGNYSIAVGSGGAAKTNGTATTGGNSQFGTCYAYGGTGGKATRNTTSVSTTAGSGGASPTLTYTRTTTTLNTAGNNGSTSTNSASGGSAVYSTYGKGGNGSYNSPVAGNSGYVKVVYKGA